MGSPVSLDDYCGGASPGVLATASASAAPAGFNPITRLRLCSARQQKQAAFNAAVINLQNWSGDWRWLTFLVPQAACSAPDGPPCGQAMSQQWASSLLGVLSGSVLPIFYGLLGAGAAVVRSLSAKVRDGQLSFARRPDLAGAAGAGRGDRRLHRPLRHPGRRGRRRRGAGRLGRGLGARSAGAGAPGLPSRSASTRRWRLLAALESLMRRVFNISGPQRPAEAVRLRKGLLFGNLILSRSEHVDGFNCCR